MSNRNEKACWQIRSLAIPEPNMRNLPNLSRSSVQSGCPFARKDMIVFCWLRTQRGKEGPRQPQEHRREGTNGSNVAFHYSGDPTPCRKSICPDLLRSSEHWTEEEEKLLSKVKLKNPAFSPKKQGIIFHLVSGLCRCEVSSQTKEIE